MVGKHRIQTFVVIVVVPTSAHPLSFLDKWFVQICLNANLAYKDGINTINDMVIQKVISTKYQYINVILNFDACWRVDLLIPLLILCFDERHFT